MPTKQLILQELAPRSVLSSFWEDALTGSVATVWPCVDSEKLYPGILSIVGTVLDQRMRVLFETKARQRVDLKLPDWKKTYCNLKSVCSDPHPKRLEEDLEHLTDLAVKVLAPIFAEVPLKSRHTRVDTVDLVELGCVQGLMSLAMPDLILGDTLVEIKCCKDPKKILKATMAQMARMVLLDRFDYYGIRNIAVYLARQGVVVKLPVLSLFSNISSIEDLVERRETYRLARDHENEAWMLGVLAPGGNLAKKQVYAIIWFFYTVAGQILQDFHKSATRGGEALQALTENLTKVRGSTPNLFLGGFTPASDERKLVSRLMKVHSFGEIMDALRGWRFALKRRMDWPGGDAASLQRFLTSENIVSLAYLAKTGNFPDMNSVQVLGPSVE